MRFKNCVLVCLLISMLISCTPQAINSVTVAPDTLDPVVLKLNWRHGASFMGFYIAQVRGFYANEGLDVNIIALVEPAENSELLDKVANGDYDFGMGGTGLLTRGQAQGIPVTVFATIQQLSPNTFFSRADSGIITLADFEGRVIGVKSDNQQAYLETLLSSVDLTLDDVEVVRIGFDMTPFYEGEVDVWIGFLNNEPIRARQQGIEILTFPIYAYGIEEAADRLFMSQELLETNPDLAVRFLRASIQGWEWALDHPEEAVDTMLEMFPDLADERAFYIESLNALIPLIRPPDLQVGAIDCETWRLNELFADMESLENLCIVEIYEQVRSPRQ